MLAVAIHAAAYALVCAMLGTVHRWACSPPHESSAQSELGAGDVAELVAGLLAKSALLWQLCRAHAGRFSVRHGCGSIFLLCYLGVLTPALGWLERAWVSR